MTVFLTGLATANNLAVAEGANLVTNTHRLAVSNVLTVADVGTRVDVSAGGELDAHQVILRDGGVVDLLGGLMDISSTVSIDADSQLVSLLGANHVVVAAGLINNGRLKAVLGSTLTLDSPAVAPWNLDGGLGSPGVVDASSGDINIASGGLSGGFGGIIKVGSAHRLRIALPWTVQGGELQLSGGTDIAGRARLEGGAIDFNAGNLVASGIAHVDAQFAMSGGLASVQAGATLRFNNSVEVSGGTLQAGLAATLEAAVLVTLSGNPFFQTVSDDPNDGAILLTGFTHYAGGTVHVQGVNTSGGVLRQNGDASVTAATTIDAGLLDLDGADGSTTHWTVNQTLTVHAARLDTGSGLFSNNVAASFTLDNPGILVLGDPSGGMLDVQLPGDDAWWMAGTTRLFGSTAGAFTFIPTMLAGSSILLSGTLDVHDRAASDARLDVLGADVVLGDVDARLVLSGGSLATPNRLDFGTVSGAGTLAAIEGAALHGHGSLATCMDFAGDKSEIRAAGGTLLVSGAVLHAGVIGKADDEAILNMTQPWNTDVTTRLELKGGRVTGGAITNGSGNGEGNIVGFGVLAPSKLVNEGAIAAKGGKLVIDSALHPDLDGTGAEQGKLAALNGDLSVTSTLSDAFGGVASVGPGHDLGFEAGWRLDAAGVLQLEGGNSSFESARVSGGLQVLAGTVTVKRVAALAATTQLQSGAQVHLEQPDAVLRLEADSEMAAGVLVDGAGQLHNVTGSTLGLHDGANLGVALNNSGRLVLGDAQGQEVELTGPVLNFGLVEIDAGKATFDGEVVNFGEFHVTDSTMTFNASYTEHGAYISDPSTNRFVDLLIGADGYLVGGAGDRWVVSGQFDNGSAQGTAWSTASSDLVLSGAGPQVIHLAGADLGPSAQGWMDNFAWGSLQLAAGTSIHLLDGNAAPGAALYVGLLDLAGGVDQLGEIMSDFNIYYDPTLGANAYLGGATYGLGGIGQLRPLAAVPAPASFAMLTASLAGLAARRRRQPHL